MNFMSIHSYAWLPSWTTELGKRAIARASAAGFGRMVVPLRDAEVIDPPAIARMFEQAGMKSCASMNQLPDADVSSTNREVRLRGLDRHRNALRLARDMGCDHIGGVLYGLLGKASRAATRDNLLASADSLATLAGEAKTMGIRLALEIVNRYESNLINTVAQAVELVKLIGADNVHLHLDTFHMNLEDDMLQAIDAALPYLVYFELDQNHRGLPDRGTLDFRPMLARLKAANYRGLIGIEAFSGCVAGPDMAAGIAIWRDLFADGDQVAVAGARIIREGFGAPA